MGPAPLILLLLTLVTSGYRNVREGATVVELSVVGNDRLTDQQILGSLRTRRGRPLVATDVTADVKDLYSRYGIRVTVIQDVRPGGVALTLRVDEEALVHGIETRGVDGSRARELLDEIGLTGVRALLGGQVRARAEELVDRLREEGRFFADVQVLIEEREGGPVAVLEIHEGPKVEVEEIEFVGVETVDIDALGKVLQTQETRFVVFSSYLRQDVLDRDLVELQRWLDGEGYRDAQVSLDGIDFDADQDEATITIRVQEGARYRAEEIRLEGNSEIATEELRARIELAIGDPVRRPAIDRDRRRLLELLGERGYVRASVGARTLYAEEGTGVTVIYVVTEGSAKRIRDVLIRGNTNTQDVVVRREVTLGPGDVASTKELRRTNERLRRLGYFVDDGGRNLVSTQFRETGDPTLEDLFIEVEETRSGRLFFTAGGMTDIGLFAGVQLEKRNFDWRDSPSAWDPVTLFTEFWRNEAFHGGGQELLIQVLPGNRVSNYQVSFTEPYLNGPEEFPLALNVEVYLRTIRLQDEYQEDRGGLGVTFTDRLDDHWRAGVSGRVEVVDISDIDKSDVPDEVEDYEGSNFVSTLGVFARYESFDSLLDPTEGYDFGARVELLVGDASGVRTVLDGSWIKPMGEDEKGRRRVLALRGSFGAASSLPFFERFHGGGSSGDFPLRGFEFRGIGPKKVDVFTGGEFAWSGSAEYRFPVYSSYEPLTDEEVERLRGVAFLDVGGIEESFGSVFGSPRLAAGVGARVLLPFLGPTPVGIDLGVPLLSESDDETQFLSIRVTTRF